MKLSAIFTSCIVALTSAVSCAAVPVNDTVSLGHFDHSYQNVSSLFDQLDQAPIEFKNCKGFDDGNAGFVVEEIGLSPNPPVRGEDLNITIKGELRQQMEQGARVKIKVWKWGVAFATLNVSEEDSNSGAFPGKLALASRKMENFTDTKALFPSSTGVAAFKESVAPSRQDLSRISRLRISTEGFLRGRSVFRRKLSIRLETRSLVSS